MRTVRAPADATHRVGSSPEEQAMSHRFRSCRRTWLAALAAAVATLALGGLPGSVVAAEPSAAAVGDLDDDGIIDPFDADPADPGRWAPGPATSEDAVASGAVVVLRYDPGTGSGALVVVLPGVAWILPLDATNVVGTAPSGLTMVGTVVQVVDGGGISLLPAAAMVLDDPAGDRLILARANPSSPSVPAVFVGTVASGDLSIANG